MKLTKQQQNCPYCHKSKNLILTENGDVVYVNENGTLDLETEMKHAWAKINYCPKCGRSLNEEVN